MADFDAPRGPAESLAERVQSYVGTVDRDFASRCRGASDAQIKRYSELAFDDSPSALPRAYHAYLRGLGVDDGALFEDFRIRADVVTTVRLYEACLRSEPHTLNPDYPIVGTYVVGDQVSFDRRDRDVEPTVVDTADGELIGPLARDWEALVMQAAILRVEARRLPHGQWYSAAGDALAQVLPGDATKKHSASDAILAHAADRGLSSSWASDDQHPIVLSRDLSLIAKIAPDGGMVLYVFTLHANAFRDVEAGLLSKLGRLSAGALGLVDGKLQNVQSRA